MPQAQFSDPERHVRLLEACSLLEPIFRKYGERQHVPGMAYGVVADGELVFTHSFGVGDVASQMAVDAETVFRIASMTKSFTALAIIKLRDAGKLALDSAAVDYVPELAGLLYPTTDTPPISVRQLLTMSAGLPQDDPWADRQLYRTDSSISQIYQSGIPFSNPPGILFEYSNVNYMLLGRIISQVAGVPATDYITQEILQPLGMRATVWNAAEVPSHNLAHGYRWQDETWQEEPLLPSGGDVACFGGLFSSVHDLARWVALFQSAWPPRDEPDRGPLRRSSLREMQQGWRLSDVYVTSTRLGRQPGVQASTYGFGLSGMHNGRWHSVGHGGGVPGFGSHMRWAPDHGIGVVALANITYANMHQACEDALNQLITAGQMPRRLAPPAQPLVEARSGVLRLLDTWDDALADELFADNFFLDLDRSVWRRQFEQLRQSHGQLRGEGTLMTENWLRGRWRMVGEQGWCWVWISLAPTTPPRIQAMEIESTLPPSPTMQAAAERLAGLTARPTRRALSRLFVSSADQITLWERVQLVNILCGPCTVQDVLAGDGAGQAKFRFVGSKGSVAAKLKLAENKDRLLDADFDLLDVD